MHSREKYSIEMAITFTSRFSSEKALFFASTCNFSELNPCQGEDAFRLNIIDVTLTCKKE
jgi:hypothetical protein